MGTRVVEFLAILLMALVLVPAGAHFFELPGKINLDRDVYFAVQQIYAGWALFGFAIFAALLTTVALAVLLRSDRTAMVFAVLGVAALLLNLAIFFTWTFPANEATASWTHPTDDWQLLRRSWEYSHAVNALVTVLGFCSVTLATLIYRE